MNKKSQAALEFIMTYGWAILVVLVAIGALAYFGVLSPDRFLPSKCTLSSGIACIDHKATAANLEIVAQNSLGYDISIYKIEAQQCTALGTGVKGSVQASLANGAQLKPPTSRLTCLNGGSKYNGNINITFTNLETDVQHKNQGQVTSRIE